jgi:hypothetical protein
LACEDTDSWGPRDPITNTDWRRGYTEYKNSKCNVVLRNNSTFSKEENVYENIRFRPRDVDCIDNPAFTPEEKA